jgi:NitT/TauT family transport system substrate-binding protein
MWRKPPKQLTITSEIMLRSMDRLEYSVGIDPVMVQNTIDYMASLGYIKNSFKAENILDLRFLR